MAMVPHPIPYQGSKRRLAAAILDAVRTQPVDTLYEPFAGSAALTLAAASRSAAERYVVGDSLEPLASLWSRILAAPGPVASQYGDLWRGQFGDHEGSDYFNRVRSDFNRDGDPVKLLFLLVRCVKNAPRFSNRGDFNQSPDRRRTGTKPEKMLKQLNGAHTLLAGRAEAFSGDAEECVADAGPSDLVYMDPPWQGTTEGTDKRYHQGFARERVERLLDDLNSRGVPWVLSYDGRSGTRTYGEPLDSELWGAHLELHAGRSSQSTLAGRAEKTVESLYLSPLLPAVEAGTGADVSANQIGLFAAEQFA